MVMTKTNRNPDAELFAMIKRCAALWREAKSCDEREAKLSRRLRRMVGDEAFEEHLVEMRSDRVKKRPPETPEVGRLLTEKRVLEVQERLASDAAGDLDLKIASAKVVTKRGYDAKCREIIRAEFDEDDLIVLAFLLGMDAERLGIAVLPDCIARRRISESWRGHKKWRAHRDAEFVHMYGAASIDAPAAAV